MNSRVERVETFSVTYPVAGHFKFFERPLGRPPGRPTVVVKVTADEGTVGWGQCVPSPRWSYETPETVATTVGLYLAPELIGGDPFDLPALHAAMNRAIAPSFSTGQPIAKAGLDLALLDLAGRLLGQSLAQRWGRPGRASIPLSWTLNPRRLDEVPAQVEQAHAGGYRSFNVKVAPNLEFDLELCRLVRQLAPDAVVWADANGGYDEATARAAAPRLADLHFAALEQPLPANRLTGYRRLKRQAALPILMDEGIVSRADLEEFLSLDLLDGVAMKVGRCGGLTEAHRVLELIEEAGLLFFGSGLTDPDLALAASLALFGAFDLQYPAALNGPQFLASSILRRPLTATDGQLPVPVGSGLGVEVDEERLTSATDV
jgi:L-alanine-DL-glutamate epimerase-like enolase superfamily enzyme